MTTNSVSTGPLTASPIRQEVGGYRVLTLVGHGGMASVYAVQRSRSGGFEKRLAMKILHAHVADDPHFARMFRDEARIAAAVQHPNVVQVFDVGEDAGATFLVMELLRGQSLSALLRTAGLKLDTAVILYLLAEAADGLHAAHEAKSASGDSLDIVHRDVSPQNIHVGYAGEVKVVDFGIAAANDRLTMTRGAEVKGKLSYMAPEQLDGRAPVDRRTDVWALGVVAWQALARERLFRADSDGRTVWNILNLEPPDLVDRAVDLPVEVADCVLECLKRPMHERPATAEAVAGVFRRAATELGGVDKNTVSACMERFFAAEIEQDDADLERAVREFQESAPPAEASRDAELTVAALPVDRPASPRFRGPAIAALALALVGLAFLGLTSGDDPAPGLAISEVDAVQLPASSSETRQEPVETPPDPVEASPSQRTIRLPIGPRVRMVLVDGVRHTERPVKISLGQDATAEVVLVGRDREQRMPVTLDSDGQRLTLPERHHRRTPRAPGVTMRRQPPVASPTPDDGLMEVPL